MILNYRLRLGGDMVICIRNLTWTWKKLSKLKVHLHNWSQPLTVNHFDVELQKRCSLFLAIIELKTDVVPRNPILLFAKDCGGISWKRSTKHSSFTIRILIKLWNIENLFFHLNSDFPKQLEASQGGIY